MSGVLRQMERRARLYFLDRAGNPNALPQAQGRIVSQIYGAALGHRLSTVALKPQVSEATESSRPSL